ncbi:M23 family metallopeptidase [Ruicaihuangia caeni]|uniref:M23 family metallopeptidase n=1 Tax=Ruicaihuangia caeni TaxID=3042517 RepID=UPI00338E15AF
MTQRGVNPVSDRGSGTPSPSDVAGATDFPLTRRALRELERRAERERAAALETAPMRIISMPSTGAVAAHSIDSLAQDAAASATLQRETAKSLAEEAPASPELSPVETVMMAMVEAAAEAMETTSSALVTVGPVSEAGTASEAKVAETTSQTSNGASAASPLAADLDAAPAAAMAPDVELTRRAATARRRAARSDARIARIARAPRAASTPRTASAAASAPRKERSARTVGVLRKVYSGAALLFAGALLVGTTLPANAFRSESFTDASTSAALKPAAQQLAIEDGSAETVAAQSLRDDYTVTTRAQVLRQTYGTRSYNYVSTGTGAIRWPFPYTVPISSGFGDRSAPCRGCSTNHRGLDLTPGAGTPIYSIADGVVIEVGNGGSYGHYVYLQHELNGQTVVTRYAHMQWDSSPLVVGDPIGVGEFVGLVGSTGQSTGPHLHLEILVNGTHVDPYVWLTANAS